MKQLFIIFLVFINLIVFAQSSNQVPYMGFPDKLPNSPQAASLWKYSEIPVGLFTGIPNISIPLYKINIKDFDLPISLNYSSNGIKVDEMATSVGLGWSITFGGVITRIINDNADGEEPRDTLPDYDYGSPEMTEFLGQLNNNMDGIDTEPDIFFYNFNGNIGKFYLDENSEPSLINPTDLKIEKLSGFGVENSGDYSFKITTDDGTVYWFGGPAAVESSFLQTSEGGNHHIGPTTIAQNAWYIAKITFPNKNDSITFDYENKQVNYFSSIVQNVSAKKTTDNFVNGGAPFYYAAFHALPISIRLFSNISRITDIHWTSGSVKFFYSESAVAFMELDSIDIRNNDQRLIKSYSFDYLTANTVSSFKNPDLTFSDPTIENRLFLTSLQDVTTNINEPNPYLFEYYFPNELPPRLSYAQDYWGYFNGKHNPDLVPNDLSLFEDNWYNSTGLGYDEVNSMFQNVGGNRNANGTYGVKGLLSKITYPTSGYDSLIFEPNTVKATKHVLPPAVQISMIDTTGITGFGHFYMDTCTTELIPFTQQYVPLNVSVGTRPCWGDENPDNWIRMTLYVIDLTDNSNVDLYTYNSSSGQYNSFTTPLIITSNSLTNYLMTYEKDHQYSFILSIIRPCLIGSLTTSYYAEYGQDVLYNKEVGGMRIKKILSNDAFGDETIKRFYYSCLDSLDISSGKLVPIKPAISFYTYHAEYFDNDNQLHIEEQITMTLSSSSLFSISNFQGNHINYQSVIEGFGNNFENGAIEHKYNIVMDAYPICYYDPILGTPNSNFSFENGNEVERNSYKYKNGDFIPVSKTINYFKQDTSIKKSFKGFTTSLYGLYYTIDSHHNNSSLPLSNLCTYDVNTQWHYLYQSDNYKYDNNGLNPILATTNYFYDNPQHMQLSRENKTDSKSNLIQKMIYYPEDYDASLFLELKQNNIIGVPIDKRVFYAGKLQSGQLIHYDENGQPIEIQKAEEENGTTLAFYTDNPYSYGISKKILNYEPMSHDLISYKNVDDFATIILWGYSHTYPIAKANNTTYDELKSAISSLQSDMDSFLNSLYDLSNEQARNNWANFNLHLSNLLPNAQITTYTYIPLVGMSSETDMNGKTTYYQYDGFGRLSTIRDNDYNVIKKYDYHYKDN